jgi:two-component system phosphate regulon sensor histidine kinase PhoR
MNTKKYQWLFYFITATIIATIGVQFYWNYKNYEENKQRVTNEIQLSFDNAIEEYYATLAKDDLTTIIKFSNLKSDSLFHKQLLFDSIINHSNGFRKIKSFLKKDSSSTKPKLEFRRISITSDDEIDTEETDSLVRVLNYNLENGRKEDFFNNKKRKSEIHYFSGHQAADSISLIENLKPIFLSITSTDIEYNQLDSLVKNQLKNKNISIEYILNHLKKDTLFYASKDTLTSKEFVNSVTSKSTYLKRDEELILLFNNPNYEALKRSTTGILLSLLLSFLIISCLFYLLKIINQQKELAAIKNDLISNITHEFKTPIATISTAIEAIENFNVLDDKVKTKKYLSMSAVQLKKLHQMVEKLLETATLDSEQLLLKKEMIDIVELTEKLVNKHKILSNNKELNFSTNLQPIYVNVDAFHFENAISNLIDNAVKYGGNQIEININSILKSTEITIADDGNGIEKNQQEKIFDKFYRVPKGNTHNVKGFGIGLYYCKKIIEKHTGTISLSSDKNETIFKINIPNE